MAENANSGSPDISVTDVSSRQRFEARTGNGDTIGILTYERAGDVVVFSHTEVENDYEGAGVGSQLARVALDQARTDGLKVDPRCPFVRDWIDKHEDYQDLITFR